MIKVIATGRVTKDATVFKYGENKETSGVSFSIASNDSNGYDNQEPTFLDCVIFNRDESLAKHILQGNQLILNGDLKIKIDKETGMKYPKLIVSELEFGAKKS